MENWNNVWHLSANQPVRNVRHGGLIVKSLLSVGVCVKDGAFFL